MHYRLLYASHTALLQFVRKTAMAQTKAGCDTMFAVKQHFTKVQPDNSQYSQGNGGAVCELKKQQRCALMTWSDGA